MYDLAVDWYDLTAQFHRRTFELPDDIAGLPEDWQRELAALWRAEADINNGAYLQFLANWGRDSYIYASAALKKIGAVEMARIVDQCQALVDEHFPTENKSKAELDVIMPPGKVLTSDGIVERTECALPDDVVRSIYHLSYQFMDYPEDLPALGMRYYSSFVDQTPNERSTD